MLAHRLILRVDYLTSYEMMDRPGSIARTFIETAPDFFSEIREERRRREIQAVHRTERTELLLTCSPTEIVINFHSVDGISLPKLLGDPELRRGLACVAALRRTFGVLKETRVGFRVMTLASLSNTSGRVLSAFKELLASELTPSVTQLLGEPSDVGVSLDGQKDGVLYHLRFGPYLGRNEVARYFTAHKELFSELQCDFILDIDLYEENVAYGPDLAWWKGHPALIANVADACSMVIRTRLGEKGSKAQ